MMTAQRPLAIGAGELTDRRRVLPLEPATGVIGNRQTIAVCPVPAVGGDSLTDISATRYLVTVIREGAPGDPQKLLNRVTT